MVELTKLDGRRIFLNIDSVKYMEQAPHTILHMINGDSVLVKESPGEIAELLVVFKSKILRAVELESSNL
jgi:uncharacterized protein YlzI (FlbEa/FlbD family)